MINKRFKKYIICVLCGLFFVTILSGKNVSAYNIRLDEVTGAFKTYNTTPARSHTYFGVDFTVNGRKYSIRGTDEMCYCNSRSIANYVTPDGGIHPWYNYYDRERENYGYDREGENYDAWEDGDKLAVIFHFNSYNPGTKVSLSDVSQGCHIETNLCDLQDIKCVIEKPGYDKEEEEEEIRDGRPGSFDINAGSQVASVDNAKENSNNIYELIYELTGESATVNYRHELWHENGNFSPNVDYWNDSISGSTYVSVWKSVINSSKIGQTAKLNINDVPTDSCQNISYRSKTWTYRYKQRWLIRYNVHYDGDGNEIGRDKISETPIGAEYVDVNSLAESNNEGASERACAHLHRPWNFEISNIKISNIEITNGEQGEVVKIGDESYEVVNIGDTVEPKFDIEIKKHLPYYAITDIPNATIELCETIDGVDGGCMPIYSGATISGGDGGSVRTDSGYVYSYYNTDPYTVKNISGKITISDVQAGARVCAQLKVNPTDSGNGYYNNFNWQNPKYSEKKCYIVAKRPTVQVWGGNVVSGGSISTRMTRKKDKMFGSWGELGAIAGGTIDGFASGASLAGGAVENVSNNKLMVLTFANTNTNALGGNFEVNLDNIKKNKDAIIYKIENSGAVAIENLPEGIVDGQFYIKKDGDLFINRNIEYNENSISFTEMPKVFIYATGNINISCDVTRLDAIIVSDGTVNTCYDSNVEEEYNTCLESGESVEKCTIQKYKRKELSKQLVVNGMIIANELNLNRTYGAAAGVYSGVPAEIINYDPTIELITIKKDDDRIKDLNSVYAHELAPRY